MRNGFVLIFFAAVIAGGMACSKDDDGGGGGGGGGNNNCDNTPKAFAANVNPIIQTFCNQPNCHNAGSVNGPGPLTNHSQVFNARNAIRSAVQSGLMPQNATLTAAQKSAIICWIDAGAPND